MKAHFNFPASLLLITTLLLPSMPSQASEHGAAETMAIIKNTVSVDLGGYIHFTSSDDYSGAPIFSSIRVQRSDNWQYGLALFNNSFGQFSQYLFGGYRWKLKGSMQNFHIIATAGILHGYKDEFEDKVPFNYNGWSPGVSVGFGYKKGKLGADITTIGTAGLMFTIGYDIWDF